MTWLAERWLKWRGWRFVGQMPQLDKFIIIGAPHTSNWDFVLFLGAIRHWDLSPKFVGKHTLFRWPFGYFFRRLGGIPVDRDRPGGMVRQVADQFEQSDQMILVVAPEGTRKAAEYWKSGFARIAAAAQVPIVPVFVDYPGRRVVAGDPVYHDGNEKALMDRLRPFFDAGAGKDPTGKGPVRLKEEGSV
jgi:1-acyl-sn-glycerol-3-phosphate acyltransferase